MIMNPAGTPAAAAEESTDPSANCTPDPGPFRIKLPLTVWLPLNVLDSVVNAVPVGIGPTGPGIPGRPIGPGIPAGPAGPGTPAVPAAPSAASNCQFVFVLEGSAFGIFAGTACTAIQNDPWSLTASLTLYAFATFHAPRLLIPAGPGGPVAPVCP